mmetsp:Transcript_20810/g.62252  ORF Transcript_20810/g.62252 Transcript_20810/m.62252 type:complete len:96 (+) Transcript_20810:83-370(+)
MAALTDATNLAKQMEAAAIKPKQAISPPSSPTRSARVPTATSPARCFAPKDATDLKKQELAGSFSNFAPEPLLEENPNRFVLFPIEHNDVWAMYK